MNAISMLKSACVNKPFKSFKNLLVGDYIVEDFQRVTTSYGDRVRIEIFDAVMYLPERFSRILSDGLLTELNESTVVMSYSGKDPNTSNRLLLDFDVIRTDDSAGDATATSVMQTASAQNSCINNCDNQNVNHNHHNSSGGGMGKSH